MDFVWRVWLPCSRSIGGHFQCVLLLILADRDLVGKVLWLRATGGVTFHHIGGAVALWGDFRRVAAHGRGPKRVNTNP